MVFDTNAANAFTVVLTNLNMILAARREERKTVNYPTFSKRGNKDINNFIMKLEKVFTINKILDNRKYLIVVSCLKRTATNFYNRLVGIIR